MKFKNIICLFLILSLCFTVSAQPFAEDIAAFKKQDSISFPPENAILFAGSSSFRLWEDIGSYFPGYAIINRGFGGSALADMIRYEQDIIFPYQPKQVVIYCGENDIAASDTVTAEMVLERFEKLFTDIRTVFRGIPLIFVSIKPSPSRWHMKERMKSANERIRKYLKKQDHAVFVDVWKSMLGPDGKPLREIFTEDNLHMNAKGYAIWQKLITPHLLK